MSKSAAKKLNLALYLNPETSEADRYAVGALQQWYDKAKRSHNSNQDLEMVVRLFHRDIYLAGLYLHLLSPRLCKGIGSSLDHHNINLVTLHKLLQASGLELHSAATEQPCAFSETQLGQLQELLATLPGEADDDTFIAPQPQPVPQPMVYQQPEMQAEQFNTLMGELQQLKALAQEHASALRRLKSGVKMATSSDTQSAGNQLEELDVSELAPQLEQIQKIRQKGFF